MFDALSNMSTFFLALTEYIISEQKLNWKDARQSCKDKNGDLVIINNAKEKSHIIELIQCSNDDYWIGLSDIQAEGIFKWISSNFIPNFTDWYDGNPIQPDNNGGQEDCVELRKIYNFQWNDFDCSSEKRYICETGRLKASRFI